MNPEEVERVIGSISEKDVMDFARRKLWDQDVAVSAVGSIEGLLDYNRIRLVLSKPFNHNDLLRTRSFTRAILNAKLRNDMSRNA